MFPIKHILIYNVSHAFLFGLNFCLSLLNHRCFWWWCITLSCWFFLQHLLWFMEGTELLLKIFLLLSWAVILFWLSHVRLLLSRTHSAQKDNSVTQTFTAHSYNKTTRLSQGLDVSVLLLETALLDLHVSCCVDPTLSQYCKKMFGLMYNLVCDRLQWA